MARVVRRALRLDEAATPEALQQPAQVTKIH